MTVGWRTGTSRVRDSSEIDYAFKNFASALPPLEGTLAAEEEWKKMLEAEKKRQNSEGVGE